VERRCFANSSLTGSRVLLAGKPPRFLFLKENIGFDVDCRLPIRARDSGLVYFFGFAIQPWSMVGPARPRPYPKTVLFPAKAAKSLGAPDNCSKWPVP
jgi:hypothetical protein